MRAWQGWDGAGLCGKDPQPAPSNVGPNRPKNRPETARTGWPPGRKKTLPAGSPAEKGWARPPAGEKTSWPGNHVLDWGSSFLAGEGPQSGLCLAKAVAHRKAAPRKGSRPSGGSPSRRQPQRARSCLAKAFPAGGTLKPAGCPGPIRDARAEDFGGWPGEIGAVRDDIEPVGRGFSRPRGGISWPGGDSAGWD